MVPFTKRLCIPFLVLMILLLFGCTPNNNAAPIEETYEYTTKSSNYVQPAVVDGWVEKDALKTTTEEGTFFCFTTDTAQADDFINAQRTLLQFLQTCEVEIGEMEYYGTDYDYCFSESSDHAAYIALSSVRSWQQVLVTLQTLWGDYTDYGYVYAMANIIAEELGWQAEPIPSTEKAVVDTFFSENPEAIHLLYPTFTTRFASEETVDCCKVLSHTLFEKIKWRKELSNPIDEQLDNYYSLLCDYAHKLSVPFTRQTCGYAYYGENVKLRILTSYAELIVDDDYNDVYADLYGDYFSNYSGIYQTANIINDEISLAVESFGLEDKAGVMKIKWLDNEDSYSKRFTEGRMGMYYSTVKTAYVTSAVSYLHEYYHHMEQLINPNHGKHWQSQTFCELGEIHSWHSLYRVESLFTDGLLAELFYACTGRTYQSNKEDYYEVWDILCAINSYGDDSYEITYDSPAAVVISLGHYLLELYGEDITHSILLFPETVEDATGKTWSDLETEWKQYIREKYASIDFSDWI